MNFRRSLPAIRCLLGWAFGPRNVMKNGGACFSLPAGRKTGRASMPVIFRLCPRFALRDMLPVRRVPKRLRTRPAVRQVRYSYLVRSLVGSLVVTMKTAISIDDGLLQEADETARLMGLSRSRLFALAVGDFLQRRRREQMLLRLNEVYAEGMEPAETPLLKGIKAKVRRAVKERW